MGGNSKRQWVINDGIYLSNPVRVENSQVSTAAASPFLSNRAEGTLEFEGVDSLSGGFTIHSSLPDLPLTTAPADSDPVNNEALLGLVSQATCLIGTAGAARTHNHGELSVLPASKSGEEAHHIGLLLPP